MWLLLFDRKSYAMYQNFCTTRIVGNIREGVTKVLPKNKFLLQVVPRLLCFLIQQNHTYVVIARFGGGESVS